MNSMSLSPSCPSQISFYAVKAFFIWSEFETICLELRDGCAACRHLSAASTGEALHD